MFLRYSLIFILVFLASCSNTDIDERLIYLSQKMGDKSDSIFSQTNEQVLILLGDKACIGCVDIALDKLYEVNAKYRLPNTYFVYPDYYIRNRVGVPTNIFVDSIYLVNTTQFLSYFTLIRIKNYKINEISQLDYNDVDSIISILKMN